MSASCVTRKVERRIERRTRLQSWGIEIETWQLVGTRTLPSECARLSSAPARTREVSW
jgi:hypothetical protein